MATYQWINEDTIEKTEQTTNTTTYSLSALLARKAEYEAMAAQYTALAVRAQADYDELIAQAGRPA